MAGVRFDAGNAPLERDAGQAMPTLEAHAWAHRGELFEIAVIAAGMHQLLGFGVNVPALDAPTDARTVSAQKDHDRARLLSTSSSDGDHDTSLQARSARHGKAH